MTDISVIARDTKIGMPATRFLGPALGSLHMFFHRLGPVLARRMLLTGDIVDAGSLEHLGIFTDTCDADQVTARAQYWAAKAAKMPADGVVIAKEAFRLVEQSQAYQGRRWPATSSTPTAPTCSSRPVSSISSRPGLNMAPKRRSGCVTSIFTSRNRSSQPHADPPTVGATFT